MSWLENISVYGILLLLFAHIAIADVMVQLNINRPINDVSEKFVSFTIRQEDLYKALDSPKRKTITRMASMLSHSYVKFVGDYYFADNTEGIRLRNPTKIVWKGFNKWTKAVNWLMIIPVPYKPNNWDPMETLKILNTSQALDINEVIWQLGKDFGPSRAIDYVTELQTFNIMVDSFNQTVTNWQTMGADISSGSSPEETRRYVEMSRDLNVAYGWMQSEDMFLSNRVGLSLDGQDPALKELFKAKVPVWLSLPKKKTLSLEDEVIDGLSWAKTMGEAANVGFETIFKPLTLEDMEKPNYGFYVTALFKKIMGSRVYPARPLSLFGISNKLYTHCANMVSGGLAFMVVNTQKEPLQIAVRSMNKLQDAEVWQYALTMQNGQVMLNNNELSINSTLMPEVRRKNSRVMLQLKTPGFSVSFWVLPNANLDHCHFVEVETPQKPTDNNNQKIKRYSSSDRLLAELIKESTKPSFSPSSSFLKRHRRSVAKGDRFKRFVLKETKDQGKPLTNFAAHSLKDDIFSPEQRIAAIEWLKKIFKDSLDLPLLSRNARQSHSQKGPFFMTRDGKRTAFTKKITEFTQPETKVKRNLLEDMEFDEEKFFQNVEEQPEPKYRRVPKGDVFLKNIAAVDNDELEEKLQIETEKTNKAKIQKKEISKETKFSEASSVKSIPILPSKVHNALGINNLPFSDPLAKHMKYDKVAKNVNFKEHAIIKKVVKPELHKGLNVKAEINDDEDVVNTQIDVTQKLLKNTDDDSIRKYVGNLLDACEEEPLENTKPLCTTFLSSDNLNFFGDSISSEADKSTKTEGVTPQSNTNNNMKDEKMTWWDEDSSKRLKRSLDSHYSANSWRNDMIRLDHDPISEADELSLAHLRQFENKVDEVVRSTDNNSKTENVNGIPIGKRIVNTFKEQLTRLVDILSHHANEWYHTFTNERDSGLEETSTVRNRLAQEVY